MTEEAIFHEALDQPDEAERAAYLEQACSGDEALRQRVELLLSAYGAGEFLESPASGLTATADIPADDEMLGTVIGPYKLLERIGEGGMGVVYMAQQTGAVKRKVALKLIKPGMDSRQVVARFEAERQTLALMDHPNIARIFDAGMVGEGASARGWGLEEQPPSSPALAPSPSPSSGRPYFVMELVRGLPITDFCDCENLDVRRRLELFIDVCRAVQHAHQKGIIHRDLKPTNVLVTLHDGVPVVKVIDFGVAKALNQELTERTLFTQFAQMIGTPLYMSPEQAELSCLDVDTRSDVYSLGVLLYELLTGTTPFDEATFKAAGFDEMRRMIRELEPQRPSARLSTLHAENQSTISLRRGTDPRKLRQLIRGELDWIAMKALEKDRIRRYESSSALAADIERHLADLPILARPASLRVKANKWRRRHPAAAMSIGAAVLLVLSLAGGATWHAHALSKSLAISDGLRVDALRRETALRQEQYYGDIRQAWHLNSLGHTAEVRYLLDRYQPQPNQPEVTGFEWHYLRHLCRPPRHMLTGHGHDILAVDVSPSAWSGVKYIATGDKGGELRVWELDTGRLIKAWNHSNQEICTVRFSPDGKLLATAGVDQIVHFWSVENWREVAALEKHEKTVTCVAWSPDGRSLASSDRDHLVHVWNVDGRQVEKTLQHADVVRAVAWSPSGELLATAEGVKCTRLWDVASWTEAGQLAWNDENGILCVAFSPDGKLAAVCGYGGTMQLFDVATFTPLATVECPLMVWTVVFLDNEHFATGTSQGWLQVKHFDRRTKKVTPLHQRTASSGCIRGIVVGPDARSIVTISEEARVAMVWDGPSLHGRFSQPFCWPNGYLHKHGLVLTGVDHVLAIVNASDGREVARMDYCPGGICGVESPSQDLVAVQNPDGKVRLWSAIHRRQIDVLAPVAKGQIVQAAFSADDRWLAAHYQCGTVGAWDLKTRQWHTVEAEGPAGGGALCWAPGRNWLAHAESNTCNVAVWDADLKRRVGSIKTQSTVNWLCFLDDRQTLAIAQHDGRISLWNSASGAPAGSMVGHTDAVRKLSLSPDGRTLASVSKDGTVRLWNVATRRELFILCRGVNGGGFGFQADGSLGVATEAWSPRMFFPGADSSPPSATTPRVAFAWPEGIMPRKKLILNADMAAKSLRVQRLRDGTLVAEMNSFVSIFPVASLAEDRLAVAETRNDIRIWGTATWKPERLVSTPQDRRVFELDFSADSQWLVAGCMDGVAGAWNVQSGKWEQILDGGVDRNCFVQCSPSSNVVACAIYDNNAVELWDLDQARRWKRLTLDSGASSLCFSPDGGILAVGETGSAITLWDTHTGVKLDSLAGHTREVTRLAFSPDGRTLVSGSKDQTARLWSVATRRELFAICHATQFNWFNFVDGSLLVAHGRENKLDIFPGATHRSRVE